jgi:hypothetical protein
MLRQSTLVQGTNHTIRLLSTIYVVILLFLRSSEHWRSTNVLVLLVVCRQRAGKLIRYLNDLNPKLKQYPLLSALNIEQLRVQLSK